jgi:hypothetical protein
MRSLTALFATVAIAGCATVAVQEFDRRYGQPDPARFDAPAAPVAGGVSYRHDVQPIFERRCVACHGCYDAPCQLKLTAWEGVARGLSPEPVYDADRLLEAPPTRLFTDAQRPSQWRARGFSPVINEHTATPANNTAASLLYRSLALKTEHPLPTTPVLTGEFDFSLDRKAICPRIETFDAFAKAQPLAGMPYGLPGLEPREVATIARWLEAGAPYDGDLPLTPLQRQQVQAWEAFLNGSSDKERLMSRYVYEHLFLGHLTFQTDPTNRAFRIVRSSTASGQPVAVIATRRPYDDPGTARFYYRLEPERETIIAKTHMPYALSAERMAKYRAWFLSPATTVTQLPSYAPAVASNPFITFRELPMDGRYRFLLDEAEYFVMNFIKGPVCRGQLALDVIEDRFWVFFVDPRSGLETATKELAARERTDLRLPAEWGSNAPVLTPWIEYSKLEQQYLRAKSAALDAAAAGGLRIDTSLVWNGDGRNPNAALTIFRHFNSASVVKGLVGTEPKTAWIIDYPLFERIYYLLVAGYDVYGNAGHQLNSRLYMDYLRMEGEFNFLLLLPREARQPTAEYWYRGAPDVVTEYVYGRNAHFDRASDIAYKTTDPQRELYGLLRARVAPTLAPRFELATVQYAGLRRELDTLAAVRGASLAWLPEASLLRVDGAGGPQYFSLLRNTAHKNVAHMFKEAQELVPAENTLTVVPGFIGAYPNAIYRLRPEDLPAFTAAVASLASEADYRRLADRFAVRRTNPGFWAVSDQLVDAYVASAPREAGILDYSRLENR